MGSTKYSCFPRWADRWKIVYYLSCLVEVNDKQTRSLEVLGKIAQKKGNSKAVAFLCVSRGK